MVYRKYTTFGVFVWCFTGKVIDKGFVLRSYLGHKIRLKWVYCNCGELYRKYTVSCIFIIMECGG